MPNLVPLYGAVTVTRAQRYYAGPAMLATGLNTCRLAAATLPPMLVHRTAVPRRRMAPHYTQVGQLTPEGRYP